MLHNLIYFFAVATKSEDDDSQFSEAETDNDKDGKLM